MAFINWLQENWSGLLWIVFWVIMAASGVTALVDGPDPDDKASKALAIFDKLKGLLRMVGIGTYANEPGTLSVPLAPDSGERVAETKNVKKKT